ncbi:MAG: N-acyl amino acid synthase FeeM domain-containing protein [Janthinobacterium lividum]
MNNVAVQLPPSQPLIRSNVASTSHAKTYRAVVALDASVRRDAFALRHSSYLDSGFIEPRAGGLFRDEFDDLANSATIVVYDEERPIASVRVCFVSRTLREAPAHHAFPDEVDTILTNTPPSRAGVEVAEITRLVRSPDTANNQGLVFLLYRLAGDLVIKNDVQVILSSVRRNHIPFYRRIGFVDVAGPRAYPGLNCAMHLLSCSRAEYDRVRAAFPLMNPAASPRGTFDGFEHGRPVSMPLTPAA